MFEGHPLQHPAGFLGFSLKLAEKNVFLTHGNNNLILSCEDRQKK
jgi:hypothetical protein